MSSNFPKKDPLDFAAMRAQLSETSKMWKNDKTKHIQLNKSQDYTALSNKISDHSAVKDSSMKLPVSSKGKSSSLQDKISEFRAYVYLLRQEEAKTWIANMLNDPSIMTSDVPFSDQIRDGMLLCRVANAWAEMIMNNSTEKNTQGTQKKATTVLPEKIKKIHKVPKNGSPMEFMMSTDNLSSFFRACEAVKFPKFYFFTIPDLWEKKNIPAVVHCIHALAQYLEKNGYITDDSKKLKDLSKNGIRFNQQQLQQAEEELNKLNDKDLRLLVDIDSLIGLNDDDEKRDDGPTVEELFKKYGFLEDVKSSEGFSDDNDNFASAENCTVEGRGTQFAIAGQDTSFTIVSRNSSGYPLDLGGEDFECFLVNTETNEKVKAIVNDLGNGKYEVTYNIKKAGPYLIDITLDGQRLSNCPSTPLRVVPSDNARIQILESNFPQNNTAYISDKLYKCKIRCTDQFGNIKEASSDDIVSEILYGNHFVNRATSVVNPLGNGEYELLFSFPAPGSYKVNMKWNNKPNIKPINLLPAVNVQAPPMPIEVNCKEISKYTTVLQFSVSTKSNSLGSSDPKYVSILLQKPINRNMAQNILSSAQMKSLIQNLLDKKWIPQAHKVRVKDIQNNDTEESNANDEETLNELSQNDGNLYWKFISCLGGNETLASDTRAELGQKYDPVIEMVQFTDELPDWSEYENKKLLEIQKLIDQQKRQKMNQQPLLPTPPPIHPNYMSVRPRLCAINFWVLISNMITIAKKQKPVAYDDKGIIRIYDTKDLQLKQYTYPNHFSRTRKLDVRKMMELYLSVSQRYTFEVLHEMKDNLYLDNNPALNQELNNCARNSFQKFKQLHELAEAMLQSEKSCVPGNDYDEVKQECIDDIKNFFLSLKREYLKLLKEMLFCMTRGMYFHKVPEGVINGLECQFFTSKFDNFSEIEKSFQLAMAYELSSKSRNVMVQEIVLFTPYKPQQITPSYAIQIPINVLFDQFMYEGKRGCRSAKDRSRLGLVNPYKVVYVKNGSVIFEALRSACISSSEDKWEEREKMNIENACELMSIIAANHCKRFTRAELNQMNEPLVVPFTSLSLLTPFFMNEREDRKAVEHQHSILAAMNQVKSVTIDLHDSGAVLLNPNAKSITVPVRFQPILLNFGTNALMKTLQFGIGIQRALNNRPAGMRAFEKRIQTFLGAIAAVKADIREKIKDFMNTALSSSSRSGSLYLQELNTKVCRVSGLYRQLLEIQLEQEKKNLALEVELKNHQKKLEQKIEGNEKWIYYFQQKDLTSIEYFYQTKIKSVVSYIERLHSKIYAVESDKKYVEKMVEYISLEERFINDLAQILFREQKGNQPLIMNAPVQWNDYFDLVYRERDVWNLFKDLQALYHSKAHESFSQSIIETDVKDVDPYAVPVRVMILSFLIGDQCHFNCKTGKDRSGELQDQCIELSEIRSQFGEYTAVKSEKKVFNDHRRTIHTTVALNGGSLEINRINTGLFGSKVDKQISGRFLKGFYHTYKGLSSLDKLSFASSDNHWKSLCTNAFTNK